MTFPPAQGRQLKTGVTFLAWLNIYQNLKQAIQDVIAPEMQQLRGDIKALSAETAAVRQELTLFQTVVNRQFDAIDKRFDALKDDIDKRFDTVDKRFDAAGDAVHTRFEAVDPQGRVIRSVAGRPSSTQPALVGTLDLPTRDGATVPYTVRLTKAPTFSSLRWIVPQLARANWV